MKNIDAVQLAAMQRAAVYLNKKAREQQTGVIRTIIAGILFWVIAYITFVIALAL